MSLSYFDSLAKAQGSQRKPGAANTFRPLLALAIAGIAWLLYARTLSADFVWDARAKILISDYVHQPGNLFEVISGRVLTRDVLDNNRPSNLLSLMIDSALWGKKPAGYHATSVTLHAAVCAMLFLIILRLVGPGGEWPAFTAALLFAVHPLNCESVSEVSYREDILVVFSILAALFAAMAFLRKPGLGRNTGLGLVCCLALFFGVGAKENGVAGPVIIAAYWLLWRRGEPRIPWLALIGGASLVVFGFLMARFSLAPEHSMIFTQRPVRLGGSLAATLLIQVRIWAMQFSRILFPNDLCADYGPWSLRGFSVPVSTAVVSLVLAGQIWLGFQRRLFALGAIVFWAGLLPVANLVPIYRPMADRFLYLPLTGLSMILAEALFLLGTHKAHSARWAYRVTVALFLTASLFLATVTYRREAVWQTSLSLWSDTAARNPLSETAANNLGWALLSSSENSAAAASFQRAIQLSHSADPDPWAGLALADDAAGLTAPANLAFRRAVTLDPRYAKPPELVRALTLEEPIAGKLEVLARRNTKP